MKYRLKTWWWGRYIKQTYTGSWVDENGNAWPIEYVPSDISKDDEWEEYIEEIHGGPHESA